jgi:hypothetical protein
VPTIRRSTWSKAASITKIKNGAATKNCAKIAAVSVNASCIPNHSSSLAPTKPRRPNAYSNATPPTTGGRTIGKTQNARTRDLNLKSRFASNQANGVPKTNAKLVATSEVRNDNTSAVREVSLEIELKKLDQSVRQKTASTGTITIATAGKAANHNPLGADRLRFMEE